MKRISFIFVFFIALLSSCEKYYYKGHCSYPTDGLFSYNYYCKRINDSTLMYYKLVVKADSVSSSEYKRINREILWTGDTSIIDHSKYKIEYFERRSYKTEQHHYDDEGSSYIYGDPSNKHTKSLEYYSSGEYYKDLWDD